VTTEDRIADALHSTGEYEAAPDLWSRVSHSIEEDREHRRRVWTAVGLVLLAMVIAIAIATLGLESSSGDPVRYRVDWRLMEALEVGILLVLIGVLGPGIRRFGRGFVADVFTPSEATGERLLPLLDAAYYLIFVGYVLVTTRLAAGVTYGLYFLGEQVGEAAIRIGGLLFLMGVMHAVTLIVLPLIALVFNATRVGAKLPRWVLILLIIGGIWAILQLPGLLGLAIGQGRG